MTIRDNVVLHAAKLAELDVSEQDLPRLVEQMGQIVDFVAQLNEVPADEQTSPFLVGPAEIVLRPDVARQPDTRVGRYFEVPRVVEWEETEP